MEGPRGESPNGAQHAVFRRRAPASANAVPGSDEYDMLEEEIGMIIQGDPQMEKVWAQSKAFALSDLVMTYVGEPGTGKELFPRAVHALRNPYNHKKYNVVHCAGLNDGVFESEFFGHEKGAFTGADRQHPGAFEAAGGGTVFLDEIGDLSLPRQSTLLRVLENRTLKRVGGNEEVSIINTKIICATNLDVALMVNEKRFRRDLFSRLSQCFLNLPKFDDRAVAHRERVIRFLAGRSGDEARPSGITEGAVDALLACHFPENIRELRDLLKRAFCLSNASTGCITEEALQEASQHPNPLPPHVELSDDAQLTRWLQARTMKNSNGPELMDVVRRKFLRILLKSHNGNHAEIARVTSWSRGTIHRIVTEIELENEAIG